MMLPINEIEMGDQFQNPATRGCTFLVLDVNKEEKMIKIQAFDKNLIKEVGQPFWKKNTDRMFNYAWRVFKMPRASDNFGKYFEVKA